MHKCVSAFADKICRISFRSNQVSKKSLASVVLSIAIAATVASQLPILKNDTNYLARTVWLFAGVHFLLIAERPTRTTYGNQFLILVIYLVLYCVALASLGYSHWNSIYVRVIMLPLSMYWIGLVLQKIISVDEVLKAIALYILATFAVSAIIVNDYIPTLSEWYDTEIYLYVSKNSISQIMASAVICMIVGYSESKFNVKATKLVLTAALVIAMFLVQARAALIGLVFSWATFLLITRKLKKALFIALPMILLSLLINERAVDFIEQAFFIDKYKGQGFDTFSSGRIGLYKQAINMFMEAPLVGQGIYYVDNFYISITTELGILGAAPVLWLWCKRVYLNFNNMHRDPNNKLPTIVVCLTVFYLFESILEAHPPFGPGASTFLFWLLCGYIDADTTQPIERHVIIYR